MIRSALVVVLVALSVAGCKKSDSSEGAAPDSKPSSSSAAGDKPSAAAAPPESDWVKAHGSQDVTGGPLTVPVPKGDLKHDNAYGWSSSTGPSYTYKMPVSELEASMKHLLAKNGITVSGTREVGSIHVWTIEKGSAKCDLSFIEQMTTKLAILNMKKSS